MSDSSKPDKKDKDTDYRRARVSDSKQIKKAADDSIYGRFLRRIQKVDRQAGASTSITPQNPSPDEQNKTPPDTNAPSAADNGATPPADITADTTPQGRATDETADFDNELSFDALSEPASIKPADKNNPYTLTEEDQPQDHQPQHHDQTPKSIEKTTIKDEMPVLKKRKRAVKKDKTAKQTAKAEPPAGKKQLILGMVLGVLLGVLLLLVLSNIGLLSLPSASRNNADEVTADAALNQPPATTNTSEDSNVPQGNDTGRSDAQTSADPVSTVPAAHSGAPSQAPDVTLADDDVTADDTENTADTAASGDQDSASLAGDTQKADDTAITYEDFTQEAQTTLYRDDK